jgi:quercetin dioxygenase-like cupin family protein
MTNLATIDELPRIQVWDGVAARRLQGNGLTLAVVELEPNAIVPEHHHAAEQIGMVIRGWVTFRLGEEERSFGPGGTWRIPSDVPHSLVTGPDGAEVIDVFSPPRHDWDDRPVLERQAPRWP